MLGIHCYRLCWPNSAENMGLLMAKMFEMPNNNNKGMIFGNDDGNRDRDNGLGRKPFPWSLQKTRSQMSHTPSRSSKKPSRVHATLLPPPTPGTLTTHHTPGIRVSSLQPGGPCWGALPCAIIMETLLGTCFPACQPRGL